MEIEISNISSDGRDPLIFGPPLWFSLHNGAVFYPKQPTIDDKTKMFNLLTSFSILIPCTDCKYHYKLFLSRTEKELRLALTDRDKLFEYTVRLHNYVNNRLNKPLMDLSLAKDLYGFYDRRANISIRYR